MLFYFKVRKEGKYVLKMLIHIVQLEIGGVVLIKIFPF